MQDLHSPAIDGVISTRVGYTGGDVPNATYRNHGTHAEAIEIVFDPDADQLSEAARVLLPDPRPDDAEPPGQRRRARSYRSAIFYTSDEQKRDRRGHDRRRRCVGAVAGQGGDRGRAGRRVLGGRARAPGLSGALSRTATPATSSGRAGSCPSGRMPAGSLEAAALGWVAMKRSMAMTEGIMGAVWAFCWVRLRLLARLSGQFWG